ncbi:SDR family NAD(P)-dependent oxidoreductase [Pseudonocardia alaniniphila]|uniref:SDR family oxidoreductase n=1 Tax=Pseudonocardia alaniniphila TaxID=75291 RepID=A0ABS9TU29_9PSEU|nr:SDR family oxidoreductase [Pseudonocardia alaniniphila]MCH6172001.1 SDR family oxidoreductase [Pseudonocardia alaniniphila]
MSFNGGIAVVTGGASGIGFASAKLLAEQGARIVISDRDEAAANDAVGRLNGNGHVAVALDVVDEAAVREEAKRIEQEVGPVSILVTAAGITHLPVPPQDLATDTWDEVIRVDVRGTWSAALAFGLPMAKRRKGSVVTISSVTGFRSTPLHSYGIGKAAVVRMTENLAGEWSRAGVRVNGVAPGYTLTPLMRRLIEAGERDVSSMKAASAMGRMVEPEEVANAVVFLAGPQASAITGVTIPVDAGWLISPTWQAYGGVRAHEVAG